VNRYVKWALIEAANVVVLNLARWAKRHVSRLDVAGSNIEKAKANQ